MKTDGSDRLMSIREVSTLTGVPPHTLRFWEKSMPDILCPKRTPGGQRRYDSEMVERVRTIKNLSEEKRHSLAAIRHHLSSSPVVVEPYTFLRRELQNERILELIVDDVAKLIRKRLFQLFEAGKPLQGDAAHE